MSKRPGDPGYAAGWCIHYRYNRDVKPGQPDTCEAGVDYSAWHGTKFGSRLHLSIAAYNGHVHGHCETTDCVSWVE